MKELDIEKLNKELESKTPVEIVRWALSIAEKPLLTTNFRPYDVAIISACTQAQADIKVVWCDTGYNTPNTYKHAKFLMDKLNLNIEIYNATYTAGFLDATMGIPDVNDPKHKEFSDYVKLDPFRKAMEEHKPDIWFTNIRKGQTAFRDSIDILSYSKDGTLKVSPFYHWSDEDLDKYLEEKNLPNEFKYFDPTKALENRECGIHS